MRDEKNSPMNSFLQLETCWYCSGITAHEPDTKQSKSMGSASVTNSENDY